MDHKLTETGTESNVSTRKILVRIILYKRRQISDNREVFQIVWREGLPEVWNQPSLLTAYACEVLANCSCYSATLTQDDAAAKA